MEEIILNCEFITPAFIYGVNNDPEIRAASIKGLMRFWWRASYDKSTDVKEMRNDEIEIFGGTIKEKDEEIKYKAKVQVSTELDKNNSYKNSNFNLLKKYEGENNNNKLDGCKYLFYSIGLKGNKQKRYFDAGTCFEVKFTFKAKNKEYVYEYLRSFNLLQLLGGIGSRSRKGGGNFVIKSIIVRNSSILDISKIKNNLYSEQWRNEKTLLSYYRNLRCRKDSEKKIIYSNIISDKCEIALCGFVNKINTDKPKKTCKDLSKLKDFYYQNTNEIEDYKTYLNIIGENYKKLRLKYKGNNKRGSSPLIIKIIKDEDQYKILLIKLAGNFAIEEESIVSKLFEECRKNKEIGEFLFLKGEDKNNE